MLNKRYGQRRGICRIEYAPRVFKEGANVVVPKEDDDQEYAIRGWLKIVDIKPSYDPSKQMLNLLDWIEDFSAMTLTAQYEIVDLPAPTTTKVRRFSKLKLVEFCMEKKIWTDLKAFLERLGYYDLFVMAVYFLENDKFFTQGLEAFKKYKAQDPDCDSQALQEMIDQALQHAFDSYEEVPISDNQNI